MQTLALCRPLCCLSAQSLLQALSGVAQKHGVTIADVASRWVLDRPQARGVHVWLAQESARPPAADGVPGTSSCACHATHIAHRTSHEW